MLMKNRSLVSIDDLTTDEILSILDKAAGFEKQPVSNLLSGKVIATLFFEPSTRTRLSFESAINRLGGKIVGFTDSSSSSVSKGETLYDTIRMVNSYCDLIVMRHPVEGSARYASEIATVPVINAGDGANQHPTQTLLDLYSIRKTQGTLDNLNIFMVGDLKYGRTVHSLMMAMSRWNTTFNFIAPDELKMPDEFKLYLDNLGLKYYEHSDFTDIISRADIIYMTRVQRERFSDPIEYEKVKNVYVLRNSMLQNTKPNMRILHPLPRVNEIHTDVDSNPKAYYFEQALNGVFTRQAILCTLLGIN
jgi:aspartate carbamoyltransferase catalytic subunit